MQEGHQARLAHKARDAHFPDCRPYTMYVLMTSWRFLSFHEAVKSELLTASSQFLKALSNCESRKHRSALSSSTLPPIGALLAATVATAIYLCWLEAGRWLPCASRSELCRSKLKRVWCFYGERQHAVAPSTLLNTLAINTRELCTMCVEWRLLDSGTKYNGLGSLCVSFSCHMTALCI